MKLLRVGEIGREKIAAIDTENSIRDLSDLINDLTPETLKSEYLESLEKVFVKIRDKILPATITKLPFIKTKYKI